MHIMNKKEEFTIHTSTCWGRVYTSRVYTSEGGGRGRARLGRDEECHREPDAGRDRHAQQVLLADALRQGRELRHEQVREEAWGANVNTRGGVRAITHAARAIQMHVLRTKVNTCILCI